MTKSLTRLEGRLFAEGGCLFMVIHVNEAAGQARVSCRVDGQTQIIEMPLREVTERVRSSARLILDNLHAPETVQRVTEQKEGWYFVAREGLIGPFDSRKEAGRNLARYILSMQSVNRAPREPARSARCRRRAATPA